MHRNQGERNVIELIQMRVLLHNATSHRESSHARAHSIGRQHEQDGLIAETNRLPVAVRYPKQGLNLIGAEGSRNFRERVDGRTRNSL
jgi:hypothetical protein